MSVDDLLQTALGLPEKDRARLAHELLVSLDRETDAGAERLWAEELVRRAEELRKDPSQALGMDEVKRRVLERLRKK